MNELAAGLLTNGRRLPRLLYIGDVPIESSYHGSALLYRLLETYPPEQLLAIESGSAPSQPQRRLNGVAYRTLDAGSTRLLNTRLHAWWSLWLSLRSAGWWQRVPAIVADFAPEAVLTVAHGNLWVTAAEFARRRKLPFHVIVHDDWPRMVSLPWPYQDRVDHQFSRIYRAAASRLCVSPYMVEEYRRRYDREGQVLYPSRAVAAAVHAGPADRLRTAVKGLTLAFAGTIHTPDYYRLIGSLARLLGPTGGRVLVFGPMSAEQGAAAGLDEPNVHFRGLLESSALVDRLRAEVDVLLVPMSFSPIHAANMKISFPSKLTDYTAVGLPLLICGPDYCSAVRWARTNPFTAEVVDTAEPQALLAALERLGADPEYRVRLAVGALEVGKRMFSHHVAWSVFADALRKA